MKKWLGVLRELVEIFVEYVPEGIRAIRNVLNWRLVRSVGQLQILTRASYLLLILVPLLAATWPGVRLVINQHNKAVREAADLLRSSRDDFNGAIEAIHAGVERGVSTAARADVQTQSAQEIVNKITGAANRIGELAERYSKDYADHTISTPRLPWTLAAAFFAALFVVFGHFVYQMAAPEPLRAATWDEFVLNRKEDYAKHPSDQAIMRAQEFLRTREGSRVEESERFEDEKTLRRLDSLPQHAQESELRVLSAPRLRSLIGWIDSGSSEGPPDFLRRIRGLAQEFLPNTPATTHADMSLVERGARAEYLYLATRWPIAVLVTGLLYSMGLWIVLLVVKAQATAVINAAQWTSLWDLFVH